MNHVNLTVVSPYGQQPLHIYIRAFIHSAVTTRVDTTRTHGVDTHIHANTKVIGSRTLFISFFQKRQQSELCIQSDWIFFIWANEI